LTAWASASPTLDFQEGRPPLPRYQRRRPVLRPTREGASFDVPQSLFCPGVASVIAIAGYQLVEDEVRAESGEG
jgi:hypothetical protein